MRAYSIEWKCQSWRGVQAQLAESEFAAKTLVIHSVARRLNVPTVLVTASVDWRHTWTPSPKYLKEGSSWWRRKQQSRSA